MIMPSLSLTCPLYTSNPQLEGLARLSNEALYESLVANTALLDEGVALLVHRLKSIIINESRGYLPVLSWDFSDALQEARILLWQLITQNRYRPGVPFHNFFAHCYSNRLNKLYRDCVFTQPCPRRGRDGRL